MKRLTLRQIEDYVRIGYTELTFTGSGKNYVGISLVHETIKRREPNDKPLKGRVYNEESFQLFCRLYKVINLPIRLKFTASDGNMSEDFLLNVYGLERIRSMFFKDLFDKAKIKFEKQFEILKQVFQE